MSHDRQEPSEARFKRIETMLYLLCRHLGLEPRTNERLADMVPPTAHQPQQQAKR